MKIFSWFRDKDNRDGATAIVGILKVVAPAVGVTALAAWQFWSPGEKKPDVAEAPAPSIAIGGDGAVSTGTGPAVVAKDQATVVIGLNEEKFASMLDARMAELEAKLASGDGDEVAALRAQLSEVQRQRNNLQVAFKARVEELRRLRTELEALAVNVPEERVQAAQQALFEGETKLADQLFAEIEEAEAEAIERAAEAAYQRGKIAEDEVRWADAAEHYARAATLAPDYDRLSAARQFALRSGNYGAALRFGERLLNASSNQFGEDSRYHANALNDHAQSLQFSGQYGKAERLYRQAIEIGKATIGETHPHYAIHLNNLAALLRVVGRYEEAEPLLRRAIEIDRATIGESHPEHAIRLNNLANLLRDMSRYEEAEPLLRQAIDIGKATIGEGHPNFATRLYNLAGLLREMGRYDEAEPLYRQAVKIDKATIGEAHPEYAIGLSNLANLLHETGQLHEAEQLLREAIEIGKATIDERHPEYANRLWSLAALLSATDRREEASPLWRSASVAFRSALGDKHASTQLFASQYASFLRQHDPASPELTDLIAAFGENIGR